MQIAGSGKSLSEQMAFKQSRVHWKKGAAGAKPVQEQHRNLWLHHNICWRGKENEMEGIAKDPAGLEF